MRFLITGGCVSEGVCEVVVDEGNRDCFIFVEFVVGGAGSGVGGFCTCLLRASIEYC